MRSTGLRYLWLLLIAPAFTGCADFRVPDPNVIYIAFGDSTTRGPSERDYPDILREMLGEPPETFSNEGDSGEATGDGRERFASLLEQELFPNAQVLFFWEGGNNVTDFLRQNDPFLVFSPGSDGYPFSSSLNNKLAETQADIEAIINEAQGAGLDVYVATYFAIRESTSQCEALPLNVLLPPQAAAANEYIALLNERIRAAADNTGATLVDVEMLNDTLASSAVNYFDCNHLSAEGNTIVADLFSEMYIPFGESG